MYKSYLFATIVLFSFCLCHNKLMGQRPTSSADLSDIKELVKKEDFENLSRFLKANNFTITKSNLNYNHGSYFVIAEIECEKKLPLLKSKKGSYFDIENVENLSIEFTEKDEYKELKINQKFISIDNDFFSHYYDWKRLNWTYVSLGEPNKLKYLSLLGGKNTSTTSDRKEYGYELGDLGSLGYFGNQLKKIPNDSIVLRTHGEWHNSKPTYKKMQFRNFNSSLGTLCDYRCELSFPWTKDDFYIFLIDTAYSFSLRMEEYYPKFTHKTEGIPTSNFKSIPLMKSGKTYYINIAFGGKKKRYVLDSGASDVTLDESTYKQLVQSGIIKIKHKLPSGDYQLADGSSKTYKRTLIPEIIIDNLIIENVVATIVPDGKPLLLGKSFLDNFKTWKIDNSRNILIIEVQ